ncbi:MAG: hypothetical protein NT123_19930, partial [Proteobacteria bacterium]|nr:hypothetical protein [Pseudomonadota bacterium]
YYVTFWIDLELIGLEHISVLMEKVTGEKADADALARTGRRNQNIEKGFNTLHAGFTRKDDIPPPRFFESPITGGAFAGSKLDPEGYSRMLDDYYTAHGWDRSTGWQTADCLDELELPLVKERLAAAGRLA